MKHVSEWHYQNLGVAGHMVVWWYITFGPHNTIWTNQKNSTTLHKPWSKLVWPILQKLYIIQKPSEIYEAFRSQYWRQSNYAKRWRQRRNMSCYIAQQSQIQLFIDCKVVAAISTPGSTDVAMVGGWARRYSTSFFNLPHSVQTSKYFVSKDCTNSACNSTSSLSLSQSQLQSHWSASVSWARRCV